MAESRRQHPRQQSNGAQKAPRRASLKDALAATQQHSVPVLPALPALPPTASDADPARRGRSRSYAETWVAENPADEAASQRKVRNGARRGGRGKQSLQARESEAARILLARSDVAEAETLMTAAALPAVVRDIVQDVVDVTEEPTAALSMRGSGNGSSARLPAVRRVESGGALVAARPPESKALLIRGARRPLRPRTGRVVPRRLGPRPFAVQFLVAMVTAMLLFGAVALASPLGQSSLFGTAIQAYANTAPWIPTATPTPRPTATPVPLVVGYNPPHKPNPGQTVVVNEIKAVFGAYATGALNIARCESGYDPNARN